MNRIIKWFMAFLLCLGICVFPLSIKADETKSIPNTSLQVSVTFNQYQPGSTSNAEIPKSPAYRGENYIGITLHLQGDRTLVGKTFQIRLYDVNEGDMRTLSNQLETKRQLVDQNDKTIANFAYSNQFGTTYNDTIEITFIEGEWDSFDANITFESMLRKNVRDRYLDAHNAETATSVFQVDILEKFDN